jgi:hypothetical protein
LRALPALTGLVVSTQAPGRCLMRIWINAQQMGSSEYWRGPDRRPEHRPVIATGTTRPPERDAEASTTLQIKMG